MYSGRHEMHNESDAARGAQRARAHGVTIGAMETGRWNALTDVPGVRVGHRTVRFGDGALSPGQGPARTGVTAILPHGGNLFREKVPAASHVINGFGNSIGLVQVDELGAIETTEEAIINALFAGRGMWGRDNHHVPGLPVGRVLAILRAHGRGGSAPVLPVGAE